MIDSPIINVALRLTKLSPVARKRSVNARRSPDESHEIKLQSCIHRLRVYHRTNCGGSPQIGVSPLNQRCEKINQLVKELGCHSNKLKPYPWI